MTRAGRWRIRWVRFLRIALIVLAGGPVASPAWAGGERILTVAENAIYGGATGLLLGGVLTLVVQAADRDDVVRWGVVVGTFAGFGYGLYEARGQMDGFSERVRAGAQARTRARRAPGSEAGIVSIRTAATPGGSFPASWTRSSRFVPFPHCRKIGERPEPPMGGAVRRTSW
jgi:hypothetical protein